jgi:hypothetical protein
LAPGSWVSTHPVEVTFPSLAIGRVGEHEVELAGAEGVCGERGVGGTTDDVVRCVTVALQREVSLADGGKAARKKDSVKKRIWRGRTWSTQQSTPSMVSSPRNFVS